MIAPTLLAALAWAGPDLIATGIDAPPVVAPGETIAWTFSAENIGDQAAGAFKVRFRVSDDIYYNWVDAQFPCDQTINGLAAGASGTWTVPACAVPSVADGDWFLVYSVDMEDIVDENDEWNNFGYTPLSVASAPAGIANLRFDDLSAPASVAPGDDVPIDWAISNTGGVDAGAFTVRFRLSADAAYSWDDALLCDLSLSGLDAGTSDAGTMSGCDVPAATSVGSWYVVASADATDAVEESVPWDDNFGATSITVATAPAGMANLVFDAVSAPTRLAPGDTAPLDWVISNDGDADAAAFTVRFRLSSDATYDAGDAFLCDVARSGLDAGTSDTGTAAGCVIPTSATPGTSYVVASVDATDEVEESTPWDDNFAADTVTIATAGVPDLAFTSLSVPTRMQSGASVSFDYTVSNLQSGDAGPFILRFRLSPDTDYASSDTFVCDVEIPGLDAMTSLADTTPPCTVPSGVTGAMFVVASADAFDDVVETDEWGNNFSWDATEVTAPGAADLIIEDLAVPPALPPGGSVDLTYTERNAGSLEVGAHTNRIRLSADDIYNLQDPLLCDHAVSAVAANSSVSRRVTCTVPANATPGAAWVVLSGDAFEDVTEADEWNNFAATPATVGVVTSGPDLSIATVTSAGSAPVGGTVEVDYRVENRGDEDVGRFTNRLYWSSNAQLDGSDTEICDDDVTRLTAAGAADRTFTCTLPGQLSGGGYLIVEADADRATADTGRSNNVRASTFTINAPTQADLRVATMSVSGPILAGDDVPVSYTVRNAGSVSAGATDTRVWLSVDEVVDRRDTLLCTDAVGTLGVAASSARTLAGCTIPAPTTAGDWFVLVQLDADGAVSEADEANNVMSAALEVTAPAVVPTDSGGGSWDTASDTQVDPVTDTEPTDPTTEPVTDLASDTGLVPQVISGPVVPLGCGCASSKGADGASWASAALLAAWGARRRSR